jgi:methyltransferase
MMLSKNIFLLVVVIIAAQRISAIYLSKRNKQTLKAMGAKEQGNNSLTSIKILQISWFIAMIAEVFGLNRPFVPALFVGALMVTMMGQVIRYLSMQELGNRWTHTIMMIPKQPLVETGIYSYIRHPTWVGMTLEFAAVPLIHGAYLTAIVFSIANALLMSQRIAAEEKALIKETNYAVVFANTPRFLPALKMRRKKSNSPSIR